MVLAVAAAIPAEARSDGSVLEAKSEDTRELLRQHRLKRLARSDPEATLRALDQLRVEGAAPAETVAVAIAEVALAAGAEDPGGSLGLFLDAAAQVHDAAVAQAAGGRAGLTVALHRRAVEGLMEGLQASTAPALSGTGQEIAGPLTAYRLSWVDAARQWRPGTHRFVAASSIPHEKRRRIERSGIGAPLVAVAKGDIPEVVESEQGSFPIYHYYYPLTAVLELGPPGEGARAAVLRLIDPRVHDTHRLGARELPLALDLGAQLAAMARDIDLLFAREGLIHAGRYLSRAGLYLLEPLRPGRIPVVLVHGLSSSPRTWSEAFEGFQLDAELRRKYQFWFFAYPTGLPFPYSALLLRRSLGQAMEELEALGSDRRHHRAVLLGHSMGGLVSRLQVTSSDTALWNALFTEPPEEVDLDPEAAVLMQEILMVEPLPFVERVVFCSTPHRGSKTAANAIGKLGASLVKVPADLAALVERGLLSAGQALTPEAAARGKMPDAVQTLQPEAPILEALDGLEIDSGVTFHSIIGDRGKGDTPESSDGVVPYWSSHLEGAASERIVPSGHGTHHHPEGVEELVRILREHLSAGLP